MRRGTGKSTSATPFTQIDDGGAVQKSHGDTKQLPMVIVDRNRLCSDILNTSVMAALIGGFALSTMQLDNRGETALEDAFYVLACISVHACTCSCLTSALLYRVAVRMHDDYVPAWASKHKLLLFLPLAKFGFGCFSYLLSVILLAYRDLSHSTTLANVTLAIGVMSLSMVLGTVALLMHESVSSKWQRVTVDAAAKVGEDLYSGGEGRQIDNPEKG